MMSEKYKRHDPQERRNVLALLDEGVKLAEVAKLFDVPEGTVKGWVRKNKLEKRREGCETKAPPDKVAHIHSLDSPYLGKGARCDEEKPVMSRAPAPGDIPYSAIPLVSNPTSKGSEVVSNPEARKSCVLAAKQREAGDTANGGPDSERENKKSKRPPDRQEGITAELLLEAYQDMLDAAMDLNRKMLRELISIRRAYPRHIVE